MTDAAAKRGRRLRALRVLLVTALVLTAVFLLGGGWYFSGEIRSGALEVRTTEPELDLEVVTASATAVTLRPTDGPADALDDDVTSGLQWPAGFGQVTDVLSADGGVVTRRLELLSGTAPEQGDRARLVEPAFPDDPRTFLDAPVREVTYRSGDRDLAAWFAPGDSTTWGLLTHGRGATRTELFRLMRSTSALGMPSLDVTYRRDRENGGGLARFGQDEWRDLEAAVQYAVDSGARRVVLLGASMGGGVTAAFLERSALAARVDAIVLDSPMLDLGATIAHGAAQRELPAVGLPIPRALTWTATRLAYARYDLDGDAVDYLDDTSWLTVPALVFHGTDDGTVPDTVTRRLSAEKPELVQHVGVEGADHVASWNHDPQAYDAAVRKFLAPHAG